MTAAIVRQNIEGLADDCQSTHDHIANLRGFNRYTDNDRAYALIEGIAGNNAANERYINELRQLTPFDDEPKA